MKCSNLMCMGDDRIQNCQCYGVDAENQVCAFEENGVLYECFPGCCEGGCPGQCTDALPRPAYRESVFPVITKDSRVYRKYIQESFLLILILIIASTIFLRV